MYIYFLKSPTGRYGITAHIGDVRFVPDELTCEDIIERKFGRKATKAEEKLCPASYQDEAKKAKASTKKPATKKTPAPAKKTPAPSTDKTPAPPADKTPAPPEE